MKSTPNPDLLRLSEIRSWRRIASGISMTRGYPAYPNAVGFLTPLTESNHNATRMTGRLSWRL